MGNAAILDRPMVALLCSEKCPGKLILDTYDLAKLFRKQGVTVISGFHSPMEEECLRILLRSPHPVVWCLARGIFKSIPASRAYCRPAIDEGRLLIISPFKASLIRATQKTAMRRNRVIADLAAAVVVAHADPDSDSKVGALTCDLLAAGKPVYTFGHPANAAILDRGAQDVSQLDLTPFISFTTTESS
jgi:predicted Rossmann fold nucleotide-binding protein DprA/Smf involved in DNA uptake